MDIDTILYSATVAFLAFVLAVLTWDYWRSKTGRLTISEAFKALMQQNRNRVLVWIVLGLMTGFALGLVTGFILGHLIWPQWEVQHGR